MSGNRFLASLVLLLVYEPASRAARVRKVRKTEQTDMQASQQSSTRKDHGGVQQSSTRKDHGGVSSGREKAQEHSKALTRGPEFAMAEFPPFLEVLADEGRPLKHKCGDSFEAIALLERHNYKPDEVHQYFEPWFRFEGADVSCTDRDEFHYDHEDKVPTTSCRKTCRENIKCRGYMVHVPADSDPVCTLYYDRKNASPKKEEKKNASAGSDNLYEAFCKMQPATTKGEDVFNGLYSKAGLQASEKIAELPLMTDGFGFKAKQGLRLLRIQAGEIPYLVVDEDGHRVLPNEQFVPDILANIFADTNVTKVELAFEAGLDFRGCWGDLIDYDTSWPVCGEQIMKETKESFTPENKPEQDAAGQSGSTLIHNYKNFIIKNVVDDNEFDLMRTALREFRRGIKARKTFGNCFGTALAPTCAVMSEPEKGHWLLMRKIELKDFPGKPFKPQYGPHKVSFYDLKGPHFGEWFRDGKSQFPGFVDDFDAVLQRLGIDKKLGNIPRSKAAIEGDPENKGWKSKDYGFVHLFPKGLRLRGCGSRDAATVVTLDSLLLKQEAMTDYSLFGVFYDSDPGKDFGCTCAADGKPRFPVVVEVDPTGTELDIEGRDRRPFHMVIGLIDYIEQRVNDRPGERQFSTMKYPKVYREEFVRMWPKYFKVPTQRGMAIIDNSTTRDPYAILQAEHDLPFEKLTLGAQVMAITKIKWTSSKEKLKLTSGTKVVTTDYFHEQMTILAEATSEGHFSTAKKLPGALGYIEKFVPNTENKLPIVVRWDPDPDEITGKDTIEKAVYGVFPYQIVPTQRIVPTML